MLRGPRFCLPRFSTEDVPVVAHHSKHMPVVDDGEGYEYDDVEKHAVGDGGRC